MDDQLLRNAKPADDTYEFSDDEALQPESQTQASRHGSLFSTLGSVDMAHNTGIDRNDYSDEDIRIVYEVVVRAETILAEELTPTSRLPTHALFLAYDEILAEYNLDPSERHISKLVFMVGGVKGKANLMDKFKDAMARMDIVLAIEGQGPESDQEYRGDQNVGNVVEDFRSVDGGYGPSSQGGKVSFRHSVPASGHVSGRPVESSDVTRERHLVDAAETFRQRHDVEFLAVSTIRRWRNTSQYISYLCAESDTTRAAESEGELSDRFYIWRVLSAAAAKEAPDKVHPNAFSKRTESIAIRAFEIYSSKKALVKWRKSTQDDYNAYWDAQQFADRLPRQEDEEDNFKENPRLAGLAQRAHSNLALSRALATWANKAAEEVSKAEVAAKTYEMSLKAKVIGASRQSAIDSMRKILASKSREASDSLTIPTMVPDTSQSEPPASILTAETSITAIPHRPRPPPEKPLTSVDIATQLQTKYPAETRSATSTARPPTVIPITAVSPATVSTGDVGVGTASAPLVEPEPTTKSAEDADSQDDDELDERTMLARRHILRMRYFGAWETYVNTHVDKVEEFWEKKQDRKLAQLVSAWRDQAASQRQQVAERWIEFGETTMYSRAANAALKWKEGARREAHHRETVLAHYAERAEYYQSATKALPVLQEKAKEVQQREQKLRRYAERSYYYTRTTQTLSAWRAKAQEVSKKRQTQAGYGERADYYYRTKKTVLAWRQKAKQKRKERLRDAHLETRRIVKKSMGERCIAEWRDKLEPSHQRSDEMDARLMDTLQDREWHHTLQALTAWRRSARERADASATGDEILKQKVLDQWREKAAWHRDLRAEAREHWRVKAKSRALKNWNLSSIQGANRPEMVANALEKRERRSLRQGFETWYGQTADRLVPLELPDGTYRNVGQVIEDARLQASENRARSLLETWRVAAALATPARVPSAAPIPTPARLPPIAENSRMTRPAIPSEAYAPTPGRPQLLLGSFGRRETTTPLAPVPSYTHWQQGGGGRDSTMRRSEYGTRGGGRNARNNLRVSWAA